MTKNNNNNTYDCSLQQVEEAYHQIEIANRILLQAERYLRIVNDNYTGEVNSTCEIHNAQAMLQQARNLFAHTHLYYKIKLISYMEMAARY